MTEHVRLVEIAEDVFKVVRDMRGTVIVPPGLAKWGYVHAVWDVEAGRPERLGKGGAIDDRYNAAYRVGRADALAGRARRRVVA